VEAHANAERTACERCLRVSRRSNRPGSRGERDEEGVALRVDLYSTVRPEHLTQGPPMLSERLGVPLGAQFAQHPGRTFHIREEERDRARREGAHATIMRQASQTDKRPLL
jgi:hypothetical protein